MCCADYPCPANAGGSHSFGISEQFQAGNKSLRVEINHPGLTQKLRGNAASSLLAMSFDQLIFEPVEIAADLAFKVSAGRVEKCRMSPSRTIAHVIRACAGRRDRRGPAGIPW